MAKKKDIRFNIEALDRFSRPMREMNDRLSDMTRPVRKFRADLDSLGRVSGLNRLNRQLGKVGEAAGSALSTMKSVLGWSGAAAAGAAWGFKTQFVDVAAQFETFFSTMEQLEGSTAGARKSMDWIQQFAATTPYELSQVTDAFVKLRAYGMDPTSGLLRTLGDTASAMGKDVMAAVEAIADAVTGENERLKEFGIKGSKQGKYIVYEYTAGGRTMRKAALANDRAMIQSTLSAIWNEKYGGAMNKRSRTWEGMMSNLMDQVSRFKLLVMESGAFDFLKGKLSGLLDMLNAMADDGSLKRLARSVGEKLVRGLEAAWAAGGRLWDILVALSGWASGLAQAVGGWENLLTGVAVLIGAKVVVAVAALAQAVFALGLALFASPIGLTVAALAALALAVKYCWDRFEGFRNLLKQLWAVNNMLGKAIWDLGKALLEALIHPLETAQKLVSGLGVMLAGLLPESLGKMLGLTVRAEEGESGPRAAEESGPGEQASASGGAARGPAAAGEAALRGGMSSFYSDTRTSHTSRADVRVRFDNLPRGARVTSEGDAPLDLDMGYAMTGM